MLSRRLLGTLPTSQLHFFPSVIAMPHLAQFSTEQQDAFKRKPRGLSTENWLKLRSELITRQIDRHRTAKRLRDHTLARKEQMSRQVNRV